MSVLRCNFCDRPVDTNEHEMYDYHSRQICESCLDRTVCTKCHEQCSIVDIPDIEVSEAWGAREVREVVYRVSDCCDAPVSTAMEDE